MTGFDAATAERGLESRHRRRGAKIYFVGTVVSQVAALVRYIVLARLLGPEELGLAATLVVTASFFDLVSDMGGDRFLVQDRDGDEPSVQGLVQFVYVARGACIALILALFSSELARFYKAPTLAIGFIILALGPLIGGLQHLDIKRAQRTSDFRPEALCLIAAEFLALLVTIIAALLTRNFTAAIYGVITRNLALTIFSHLQAKRPYRLGWSGKDAPRFFHFALPLMLNGVMLYVGSQGDRVMVAKELGPAAIGRYSAVILLILYPGALVQRYAMALYMPMVAASRDDPRERDSVIDLLGGQTVLLGMAMAVGFAIVAPRVVTILYGRRFTEAALIVGLIGILQSIRFLINWPTTVCLAVGRSRAVLVSNVAKLLVFPGAFVGARLVGGLAGVVAGFAAGEFVSVTLGIVLMNRAVGHSIVSGLDRLAAFALTAAIIVGFNLALSSHSALSTAGLTICAAILLGWLIRREKTTIAHAILVARRLTRPLFSTTGSAS